MLLGSLPEMLEVFWSNISGNIPRQECRIGGCSFLEQQSCGRVKVLWMNMSVSQYLLYHQSIRKVLHVVKETTTMTLSHYPRLKPFN
jgi:hypothetical protein